MSLGRELQRARMEAGYEDEAAFSEMLGVSVPTLRAWEADIQRPGDEDLERFAEVAEMDPDALSHLAWKDAPQGICRAVDLVPDEDQAEILEQVGIPREMWADPDMWVSFLRIARAASELSAEELSLLAERAEACVIDSDA